MTQASPAFDADHPYRLTEEQHFAIYQVRHVLELIAHVSAARDEYIADLRYESLAVTAGLLGDLLDSAVPNLVRRKKSC